MFLRIKPKFEHEESAGQECTGCLGNQVRVNIVP